MRKLLLIISILYGINSQMSAQFSLSGLVIDASNNQPIEASSVVLLKKDTVTLVSGTISDAKGFFSFNELKGDEYLLSVTYVGSNPVVQKIALNENKQIKVELNTTKVLDEFVVSADRSNVVSQTASGSAFYLSAKSKKSKDIYEALQEIPMLMIDRNTRSIQLVNGGNPLILINGIRREGGINSISPSDIESIEIIETPSARYSKEGYSAIINLKVKRRADNYHYINTGLKLNPSLIFGLADATYETGNDKFSLYATGQHFHFYKNKSSITENVKSGLNSKDNTNIRTSNYYDNSFSLGGDYVWSKNDYTSFSVSMHQIPSNNTAKGLGVHTLADGTNLPFIHNRSFNDKMLTNSNNLYHKHTFDNNSSLEALLNVNYSNNENKVNQTDVGNGNDYEYFVDKLFKNNRYSGSLSLTYNVNTIKNWGVSIGSQTNYQFNRIDYRAANIPLFKHEEWNEHIFADFSRVWNKKLSISASLGLDMFFAQADTIKNNYYTFRPSATIGYKFNSQHSLRLGYNRFVQMPSIIQLNPFDTSTDTLSITTGNPYLRPEIVNNLKLSYRFTKKRMYVEPFVSASVRDNYIRSQGTIENGIYTQKPVNNGSYTNLQTGFTARLMLGKIGFVNGNFSYQQYHFARNDVKHSFRAGGLMYLYYKDLSMTMQYQYSGAQYTPVSKELSSPETQIILNYTINKQWEVNAGIRYPFCHKRFQQWQYDGEYERYYDNRFKNRGNILLVGFRYTLDKRETKRERKDLNDTENGFRLIND